MFEHRRCAGTSQDTIFRIGPIKFDSSGGGQKRSRLILNQTRFRPAVGNESNRARRVHPSPRNERITPSPEPTVFKCSNLSARNCAEGTIANWRHATTLANHVSFESWSWMRPRTGTDARKESNSDEMKTSGKCSAPNCDRPAVAFLELRSLCLSHFIDTCYAKLEELNQNTHIWAADGSASESTRTFVRECIQTASSLPQQNPELSNLERARLLDITLCASELSRRLPRSSRTPSG